MPDDQINPETHSASPELSILKKIDGKLDDVGTQVSALHERIDNIETRAVIRGGIAGAASGGLTGGIVAVGVLLARAKLGL